MFIFIHFYVGKLAMVAKIVLVLLEVPVTALQRP